jgi:hypothetical protein
MNALLGVGAAGVALGAGAASVVLGAGAENVCLVARCLVVDEVAP